MNPQPDHLTDEERQIIDHFAEWGEIDEGSFRYLIDSTSQLRARITELEAENERLRERVKELESDLSKVVNDPRFPPGRIV